MAVLFTTLLSLSAILLGYFLYDFGKQNFIRETEAAINSEIEHILAVDNQNDANKIAEYIEQRTKKKHHIVYFYQDKNENTLAGNIQSVPNEVELIKEGVIRFNTKLNSENILVAAKIHTFADGSSLLVAREITGMMKSYKKLKIFSILIMVFMLVVVLISFFISTFVVTRINKIVNTAKEIMNTRDLSRRIEVDSNWDDLSYLAKTLNDLLTRIESLMQGIRDVSDNIAHDLRTPITRLRGRLEGLKSKRLSDKDINKLISEADNILSMFNSLLRILNIQKGKRYQSFEDVDVSSIIRDVIELYEPLADEKKVVIKSDLDTISDISGDRDLLFQMFANLLDNAIKFSTKDSDVLVYAIKHDERPIIIISDSGVGIEKDDIEKVFNRFYRADKSRNTSGSGLGLSMVEAILDLHQAKITLDDNAPGLKITISF